MTLAQARCNGLVLLIADELDRVEKFAILVFKDEHGAVIREAVGIASKCPVGTL